MDIHTKFAIARVFGCVAYQAGDKQIPDGDFKFKALLQYGIFPPDADAIRAAWRSGWRDAQVADEFEKRVKEGGS